MSQHLCHAQNCDKPVAPHLLMCARHWAMVPKSIQQAVYANYRRGQEKDKNPSKAWMTAAVAAIRDVNRQEQFATLPERQP